MKILNLFVVLFFLSACSIVSPRSADSQQLADKGINPVYRIGPGDNLQVFVWRNNELTTTVPVRPDGHISLPLIDDIEASGKSPVELARTIEKLLSEFVKEPKVSVIVTGFGGAYAQQVRVVGQATRPQSIPYRQGMTLLDVMIAVGGLTDFAAGNRAKIVRSNAGQGENVIRVYLNDLMKDGDIDANLAMSPGDILIIPESWF